jgi:hypothetical protein
VKFMVYCFFVISSARLHGSRGGGGDLDGETSVIRAHGTVFVPC